MTNKYGDIKIQIIDWQEEQEKVIVINDDDEDEEPYEQFEYFIKIYGRTLDEKSVFINVKNFKPHFYVEIPDEWNIQHIETFMSYLYNGIKYKKSKKVLTGFYKYEITYKKKLYGFTAYKDFKFLKLSFINNYAYYAYEEFIRQNKITNSLLFETPKKVKIYESNIKPFIRYMHLQKINASGWIEIKNYDKCKKVEGKKITYCDINIETDYNNIISLECNEKPKILMASFDIECYSESGDFPDAENDCDKIIQIGTVFSWFGNSEPFKKHIITLKGCVKTDDLNDVEIVCHEEETNLLLEWTKLINEMNPDVITGYNINGFDFKYMHDRANKFGILNEFSKLSKIRNKMSKFENLMLASSAMGDNELTYFSMGGRVIIDLLKYLQREVKLDGYKLDYVSSYYIKEPIKNALYNAETNLTTITTTSFYGININQYVNIMFIDALTENIHDEKYQITNLISKMENENPIIQIVISGKIPDDLFQDCYKLYWCHAKDDISAKKLFELQRGTNEDRAIIAKYCIQDCVLVTKLMEKLQVINNNIGMSNVCSVPLSYIFFRGQGVKLFSLVSKKCAELNFLMPVVKPKNKPVEGQEWRNNYDDDEIEADDTKFEGAIVFPPVKGVHYEPIVVLDYASLYPSSMIHKNISHETYVNDDKYLNLEGYTYNTVSYNNEDGTTTECTYAKKDDGTIGIIPLILKELLNKREECKNLVKTTKDNFLKNVYDALQLAYKVTANSLYGQVGAKTSPIFLKELAASTTATGREMLILSKNFIEGGFNTLINKALTDKNDFNDYATKFFSKCVDYKFTGDKYKYKNKSEFYEYFYNIIKQTFSDIQRVKATIIYGDTDSVFFSLKIHNRETKIIDCSKKALEQSIKIGQLAGETIYKILEEPQKQVYEKTLYPLILISKKRYVGNLYEDNPNKFKQKCMGIVLKRRDNAKIVKIVVGNIVNYILNKQDNAGAIKYTTELIKNILKGEYGIDKFIITKTLRKNYVDRTRIGHAMLADRISERDGTIVASNERIPFVFVIPTAKALKGKTLLQGNRIEDPKFVIQNNIEIDYLHYITNQIMKPSMQFLELIATDAQKLFDKLIAKETTRRKGMNLITEYLFDDDDEDNNNNYINNQNNGFVITF